MNTVQTIIALTLMAGMAMPAGALIARFEHIGPGWLEEEFRHTVIAFGGGALLSAVALVLIPDGIAVLDVLSATASLCAGGVVFMWIDITLHRLNTPAGQLAAMLADFVPESVALGAAIATGDSNILLLAILMSIQNLPEGFNAFRELTASKSFGGSRVITCFAIMALFGPVAGLTGYFWLAEYPGTVAAIMLFASGGILYSVFQDIAPKVKLEKFWFPPMGAVLGFALGVIGQMLTA